MLENLRMQEVEEIIFSMPEGVIIPGKNYRVGEPIMIIEKPGTSGLSFVDKTSTTTDGRGLVGVSGITRTIDFTINDGKILFALWSYLHGYTENNSTAVIQGSEYLKIADNKLILAAKPLQLFLYKIEGSGERELLSEESYDVYYNTTTKETSIVLTEDTDGVLYHAVYTYEVQALSNTTVKQIHNHVICSMTIYMKCIDLITEEEHTVCVMCDRVQVMTDLVININKSSEASFTPIKVFSIPQASQKDGINKDVARIMVI